MIKENGLKLQEVRSELYKGRLRTVMTLCYEEADGRKTRQRETNSVLQNRTISASVTAIFFRIGLFFSHS